MRQLGGEGLSPLAIEIHPSEFPARTRAAVLSGLRAGAIPARCLYQSDGQAQLWLEYHRAYSPSRTDEEVRGLYRQAFRAAMTRSGAGPLAAISLGCGGGQKDGELFDAVPPKARSRCAYAPLDTSPALVLEATLHVGRRHPDVRAHPLVVDLEARPDIGAWLDLRAGARLPRLYCAFGLLPNQDPVSLLAYLRGLLRSGDSLLLSANQSPRGLAEDGDAILAQYDNVPARAWYLGALAGLGIPPADVELRVEAIPVRTDEGWWRIDVRVLPRRNLQIRLHEEIVQFRAGEPVALFRSHRFTPAGLLARLDAAGLGIAGHWQGAGGQEGIYLLRGVP